MIEAARRRLNHQVRALAQGRLGLDEETYRMIVSSVDERSEGHITRCDDERANLVLLHLRQMVDRQHAGGGSERSKNSKEQRKIARLMQFLGWDWSATARFCLRTTGKRTTRACDAKELGKVINGMVSIIDGDIRSGRIRLTPAELTDYRQHTHTKPGNTDGGSHA